MTVPPTAASPDQPSDECQTDQSLVDSGSPIATDPVKAEKPSTRRAAKAANSNAPRSTLSRWLREIAFVVLAAIVLSFVLKTFLIQSFFIPSQSMENTLLKDDRVMVSKLAPGPFKVHRGDIVVFSDPGGWLSNLPDLPEGTGITAWIHGGLQAIGLAPASDESFLIKRVIGTAGDRVECVLPSDGEVGRIAINGVELDETYIKPGEPPCTTAIDVTVPDGALWLMGDNRGNSGDSRFHQDQPLGGAVDLKKVVGVAKLRTWPLNRLAVLTNPGAVFKDVPPPAAVD